MKNRDDSCPDGFCCVRDQFLPAYVYCKRIGQLHSNCRRVLDESVCPCHGDLTCVPNLSVPTFVSMYGTCQHNSSVIWKQPRSTYRRIKELKKNKKNRRLSIPYTIIILIIIITTSLVFQKILAIIVNNKKSLMIPNG